VYVPKNLRKWVFPENYAGRTWDGYYSAGFGEHRDSDALERSNFAVAWDALEPLGACRVEERHWAVGWVAWIAIREDNETALREADALQAAIDSYPVLDENHFSALESAEDDATWAQRYSTAERIEWLRSERKHTEFHKFSDLLACARGKFAPGHDQGRRP